MSICRGSEFRNECVKPFVSICSGNAYKNECVKPVCLYVCKFAGDYFIQIGGRVFIKKTVAFIARERKWKS